VLNLKNILTDEFPGNQHVMGIERREISKCESVLLSRRHCGRKVSRTRPGELVTSPIKSPTSTSDLQE
jgi:hypothetical protein